MVTSTKCTEAYLSQSFQEYEHQFQKQLIEFIAKYGGDGSVFIDEELNDFIELLAIPIRISEKPPKTLLLNWDYVSPFNDPPDTEWYFEGAWQTYEDFILLTKTKKKFLEGKSNELHIDGSRKIKHTYQCLNFSHSEFYKKVDGVLFEDGTKEETFVAIFSGKVGDSIQVKNGRLLAYFLQQMNSKKFIPDNWQSIAEKNNYFISKTGKKINANDLSSALTGIERSGNPQHHDIIDEALKTVKVSE